jgi:hypothetical protein
MLLDLSAINLDSALIVNCMNGDNPYQALNNNHPYSKNVEYQAASLKVTVNFEVSTTFCKSPKVCISTGFV